MTIRFLATGETQKDVAFNFLAGEINRFLYSVGGALGLPPVSTVGNEGPLPYFFLGDEAFPLKEYVMRPYARRTLHEDDDKSYERRVFNYRMSRARRTIENTFGNLARRWRVLR
ncbi:hypothetical protein MRX96_033397 [Rhipicephalus microplus]